VEYRARTSSYLWRRNCLNGAVLAAFSLSREKDF
jgi:hypothetical protein